MQRALKQLEAMRIQLAEFFCEDVATFKMEECFKIFHNFSERFQHAVKDNEKRKVQEEQALIRRKQREETLRRRQCKTSDRTPGRAAADCCLLNFVPLPIQQLINLAHRYPIRRVASCSIPPSTICATVRPCPGDGSVRSIAMAMRCCGTSAPRRTLHRMVA